MRLLKTIGALSNGAGGIFARAFVGGMTSHIAGGDFTSGFVAAGLSAALVSGPEKGFNRLELVQNMIVGGTVSYATIKLLGF